MIFCLRLVVVEAEAFRKFEIITIGILELCVSVVAFGPAALVGLYIFFKEGFLVILAEWVTFETFPHQNAAQVGVTSELDSHQIPGFAFLEVCASPYIDERRNFNRVHAIDLSLDDQARSARGAVEVVDHFHFVLGEIVHAGDGGEQVEAEFIAQGGGNFNEVFFLDDKA